MKKNNRIALYDNWKFFLIFSVVLVHMFSPSRSESVGLTQNIFCNSFCVLIHLYVIPSFFFISGYFSSVDVNESSIKNILNQVLVPYIFFELIFNALFPKSVLPNYSLIEPFYHLWFIGLLFLYRIIAPWVRNTNIIGFIVVIILISCISHLEVKSMMWGSWNFVKYFPYFLIGMWFKKKNMDVSVYQFSSVLKFSSLLFLIISFYLIFVLKIDFLEVLADGSSSRELTGLPLLIEKYSYLDSFIRDFVFRIFTVLLSICVFIIIPRQKIWVSDYGSNTLYPYLLHPIIMNILVQNFGFYKNEGDIFLIFLFIISFLITIFLSMNFVVTPFKKLFNYLSGKLID